jgi:hypothetical protein
VVQVVVGCQEGAQETLIDLGVEDGDALPFVGQHVGVAARRRRALDYLPPLPTQRDAISNNTYRVIEIIGTESHPTESTQPSATVWQERRRPHADSTGSKCNRFVAASRTEPLHTFQ